MPAQEPRRLPGGAPASARLPSGARQGAGGPLASGERPSLRLALARGTLGIELDAPFALGPLTVTDLSIALHGVRFPVDLSGGVARFRHRRGQLARAVVEMRTVELAAWAAPRLRGLLGEGTPELVLAPVDGGLLVALRLGEAALAFDVLVVPHEGDVRLVPERARGLGLGAPPHALALRALRAVGAPHGQVVGGAVVLPDAAGQLGRVVLPAAGARAPAAAGVRWASPEVGVGTVTLEALAEAAPAALSERALRALEVVDLARDADAAAFAGAWDRARDLYLGLLERAPRHPELSRRLAWIDLTVGDRPEAALSTLVDALPAVDAGLLGGELLLAVGDRDGARAAFTLAAQAEPFGALAALAWLRVALLADELDQRLPALDQAVARAPALDLPRWRRLEACLALADVRGARADAQHLEAAARGPEARFTVWQRAAAAFLAHGFLVEASALFERALRYAPANADAVAGLARSLRAGGQDRRALDLFARAAALRERGREGVAGFDVELELARALAEVAGDQPAAIARVRAIPAGAPEAFEARLLEGRWRAQLGDLAGAAQALGRLRSAVELAPPLAGEPAAALAALLVEAATLEEGERGDLFSAQRCLGLALRLRPRDRAIGAAFRRVAAEVARAAAPAQPAPVPPAEVRSAEAAPPVEAEPTAGPAMAAPPFAEAAGAASALDEAAAERRVEELTSRLRADPRDHGVAMQLAALLEALGRDLELLALLSARLEEGDDAEQEEVTPVRRAVLLRLAEQARAAGRRSEAELYEGMAGS